MFGTYGGSRTHDKSNVKLNLTPCRAALQQLANTETALDLLVSTPLDQPADPTRFGCRELVLTLYDYSQDCNGAAYRHTQHTR